MKFLDFEYASQAKSFVVDGEIYSTSTVPLDHICENANAMFANEAKEEAQHQKTLLENHMGAEVLDGDFKTFANFNNKIYMFIVNSQIGFKQCVKVNKKRPAKFKGHACNRQVSSSIFV